jgi:ubiquinol-cytochrome c reductase cytochrome b subunit
MTQTVPPERKPTGAWGWIADWMDERATIGDLWRVMFARRVPEGVGWLYTLGAASLFAFVLQAATGIFLAMYYSPSPDHAYNSIQFIMTEVQFGAVVRGLHHWGASAMVVVVFLHMAAVFYLGAYKYPREVTWVIGVLLLLMTLAFGFTGYLLPWDEKAYWATEVGTNMPGTLPVFGELTLRIMRGGADLGALTLTRFYAIHTMLLPALLGGLIVAHMYLVVRHGVTAPPHLWERVRRGNRTDMRAVAQAEYKDRYEASKARGHYYWPNIIVEDIIVAAVLLVAVFALVLVFGVPTEAPADPTNTAYVPRPEWYFMFLFQLLKYFPGGLEWVAVGVIPPLAVMALLLLPFYDRSPWRSPRRRPIAMAAGVIALIVIAYLTWAAYQPGPPTG